MVTTKDKASLSDADKAMIKDLAENVTSMKEAQDELIHHFSGEGDFVKMGDAIEQLERDFKQVQTDVARELAKTRRLSYGFGGQYRGMFASEDEARVFGLHFIKLSAKWDDDCAARAAKADEILQRDFSDVAKAMDSTTFGGLLPTEMSNMIHQLTETYGVFERYAEPVPVNAESKSFVVEENDDDDVFVVGENTAAGEKTESSPRLEQLNPKTWATLIYVPNELEEDAAVDIAEFIARRMARRFAKKMDRVGFIGNGGAASFGLFGVTERLKNLDTSTPANIAGLQQADGNAWPEITQGNIDEMMGKLPQYAAGESDVRMFCHRQFYFSVLVPMIHAAGGVTATEIEGRRRLTYGGTPIELTQIMPNAQANSSVPLLFGNLRMAAAIGNRRAYGLKTSRDYKFAEQQITYLGTRRVAVNVHSVGNATATAGDRVPGPIVGLQLAAS